MNENVSLVISRQVLTDVSSRLLFLPDEVSKAVAHYTLDKVNLILRLVAKQNEPNLNVKAYFDKIMFI